MEYRHGAFVIGIGRHGKPEAVTPADVQASDYAWMPDSQSLLVSYRVGDRDELAIYTLGGRLVRGIHPTIAFRNEFDNGMTVSHDGKVAVVAAMPPGSGTKTAELVRVDLATGEARNLTNTPDLSEDYPSFVGDARLIFVAGVPNSPTAAAPKLLVLDLGTMATRVLSQPSQIIRSAWGGYTGKVVYETSVGDGNFTLWTTGVDGGQPERLQGTGYTWPALDPTGRWLLVSVIGTPVRHGSLRLSAAQRASP
jgi:Tol biopolymer transport system component